MKTIAIGMAVIVSMVQIGHATITTGFCARAATDGSALGGVMIHNDVTGANTYPSGFNMCNKKGNWVFGGQTPNFLDSAAELAAFDGKVAVFINHATTQIVIHAVGADGFSWIGSFLNTPLEGFPVLTKSGIILALGTTSSYSFMLYDWKKNDMSMSWGVLTSGTPQWLGKNVFCNRKGADITFYKKDKPFFMPSLDNAQQEMSVGAAGNLAEWTNDHGTNSYLAYWTTKGFVAGNITLADAGTVWTAHSKLNKNLFYVMTSDGLFSRTIRAYKLGNPTTLMGSTTVNFYQGFRLDGSKVVVFSNTGIGRSVAVYDAMLKKELWSSGSAPGSIELLGNGLFSRSTEASDGSHLTVEVFGKKGTLVTHKFTK